MVSSGIEVYLNKEVIVPFHKAIISRLPASCTRLPLPKMGLCWLHLIVHALWKSQNIFSLIWNGVIKLIISMFFCIIEQILMIDLMLCLNLVFQLSLFFWQPGFCQSAMGTFWIKDLIWMCHLSLSLWWQENCDMRMTS